METVLRVISTMVSLLPVVLAMLAMLTMLTTVRVGWMAPRMVNLMVRSFLALGRCIGAMGNVFCMLRLPSVLLLVSVAGSASQMLLMNASGPLTDIPAFLGPDDVVVTSAKKQ